MPLNSTFIARTAEAAIEGHRIVKPGATAGTVVKATGPTDKLLGTAGGDDGNRITYPTGDMVDLALGPYPKVRLGGTVAEGDQLTSDANGKAVATTTVSHRVIGTAAVAGVADDIVPYFRSLGTV